MSFEAQRILLSDRVSKTVIGLPVALPNLPFTPPKNAPYAEFWIMGAKGITIGVEGQNLVLNRYPGIIQLNVWVPKDKGTKAAAQAADSFGDAFKGKMFRDSVQATYRFSPTVETQNPSSKEGWEVQVVRLAYHRDIRERVDSTISN